MTVGILIGVGAAFLAAWALDLDAADAAARYPEGALALVVAAAGFWFSGFLMSHAVDKEETK